MKYIGIVAATMIAGAVATPNAASAQSFGISIGSPGWGGYYSDYDDDYGYDRPSSYGSSGYYGGYGVPYAYPGGPRAYSYVQRRSDMVNPSVQRFGASERPRYIRDGVPGGAISTRPRVAGFMQRRDAVIDRPAGSAGGCGTYFYWNGTSCTDARLK